MEYQITVPQINTKTLQLIEEGTPDELASLVQQFNSGATVVQVLVAKILDRFFYEDTWKEAMPTALNFWDFACRVTSEQQTTLYRWMSNYRYFVKDLGWSEEKLAQECREVGWTKLEIIRIRGTTQEEAEKVLQDVKDNKITREQLIEKLDQKDEKMKLFHTFKVRLDEAAFKTVLEVLQMVNEQHHTLDQGVQLFNAMKLLEQYLGYEDPIDITEKEE